MTKQFFFPGDLMLARGVDQVLPNPLRNASLRESCCTHANDYVRLAMKKCAIQRKPTWTAKELLGDLLPALRSREPIDLSVVNLETSVTTNDEFWPRKGVCYRASKENCLDVLATLRVDVLTLANNHTLDFGIKGLIDTLDAIDSASRVGAGRNDLQAFEPKIVADTAVFGLCLENSGVPVSWQARRNAAGLALILDEHDLNRVAREIERTDVPIKIVSLHAGGNWGYSIEPETRMVCRRLIDAGAHFVHGHSSHHARSAELYKRRLILFGCGELLNDYEGIGDHAGFPSKTYNADLRYAYFPTLNDTGEFTEMKIDVFTQANCFRLERATIDATQRAFRSLVADYRRGGLAMSMKAPNTLLVKPL